jgi:hypothetical protein
MFSIVISMAAMTMARTPTTEMNDKHQTKYSLRKNHAISLTDLRG